MSENQLFFVPSDPKEREKMAAAFQDMSNQLIKSEAIKDYVKEAKKAMKEEYEVPLAVINTLFKIFHSQNAVKYFEEQEAIEDFYDTVFGPVE